MSSDVQVRRSYRRYWGFWPEKEANVRGLSSETGSKTFVFGQRDSAGSEAERCKCRIVVIMAGWDGRAFRLERQDGVMIAHSCCPYRATLTARSRNIIIINNKIFVIILVQKGDKKDDHLTITSHVRVARYVARLIHP